MNSPTMTDIPCKDGGRPLDAGSTERPHSPWTGRQPATMMATMSGWWRGDEGCAGASLPSVPSFSSVIDLGAAAEPALACKHEASMSQLRREPRASVLERPHRRDLGPADGDQLDSLLSELLTLRSAQARLLAQPSVLKAACTFLPPCPASSGGGARLGRSPAPLRASIAEVVR